MILQTTSPLREDKDITACWGLMEKTDATTVLTVCPTHPRLYHLSPKSDLILVNGSEDQSTNIQAWPVGFILNGCFVYISKPPALLKEKRVITKKTKAVVCPKWRSVDLDTPEDWVLAEFLFQHKREIALRLKRWSK
jgi:CMP-N-acetylneuraminic acid synthetase